MNKNDLKILRGIKTDLENMGYPIMTRKNIPLLDEISFKSNRV